MNSHTIGYCSDFNEQGYCKVCGLRKLSEEPPFQMLNGKWPTGTWFQQRRAYVLTKQLQEQA